MHVETTTMDPRVARIHWRDYRDKVRKHREERAKQLDAKGKEAGRELGRVRVEKSKLEKEDEALKDVYYQLSKGQTILNLSKVIGSAGLNREQLPVLAACRADYEWCRVRTSNSFLMFGNPDVWNHKPTNTVYIPQGAFKGDNFDRLDNSLWRAENKYPVLHSVRAMVPTIPAHLRPDGDLSKYHILWEANWERAVPVDPILLSKVTETIYVVLAQWDLTPVEQMVLEGRL